MNTTVAGTRAKALGQDAQVLVVGMPLDEADQVVLWNVAATVPNPKVVWFVCTRFADVLAGQDIIRDATANGTWTGVSARFLNAQDHVDSSVGDLMGWLLAEADNTVVCDGIGSKSIRLALNRAAECGRFPIVSVSAEGAIYAKRPGGASPSLLLEALRFALTARSDDPDASSVELHERGFATLVKPGDGSVYDMTHLLASLLTDLNFARTSDHASACADLLERRGYTQEAQILRDATQFWIEQRLWEINYAPEMVLHNETHSWAVDRNVASLCEPLLETGVVDETDLLVLALAAWLHDWGHASVIVPGGSMPTNPTDVRNYHGIFSAARIAGDGATDRRHQISERFAPSKLGSSMRYGRDDKWLARDVALLCGHHQGWTSCGADVPVPKKVEDPLKLRVKQGKKGKGDFEVRSFDDEYQERVRGRNLNSAEVEEGLKKAHLRLALLRVADAADVGVHRVPDFQTQRAKHDQLSKKFFEDQERAIDFIMSWREDPDEYRKRTGQLREYFMLVEQDISKALQGGEEPTKDIIKKAFEENNSDFVFFNRFDNGGGWNRPKDAESQALGILRSTYNYGKHLVNQQAFYAQHERIRTAVPVLLPSETDSGKWRLHIHVIPTQLHSSTRDETVQFARDIVSRELGHRVLRRPDGTFDQVPSVDNEDALKRHIIIYLEVDARVSGNVEASAIQPLSEPAFREFDTNAWVRSPDGILTARAVGHGIELLSGATEDVRVISMPGAASLLAVDNKDGTGRALVSWETGTGLLRESGDHVRVSRASSNVGVILSDHAIVINDAGEALFIGLEEWMEPRPVGWLTGHHVVAIDSVIRDGRHFVVAACAGDNCHGLNAAWLDETGGWESAPSLRVEGPIKAVEVMRLADLLVVGVHGESGRVDFHLANNEWLPA